MLYNAQAMAKSKSTRSNKSKDNIRTSSEKKKLTPQKVMLSPNNIFGNVFFYIFLAIILFFGFSSSQNPTEAEDEISISEVVTLINDEKVQDVTVSENDITLLLQDGTSLKSKKEVDISFDQILTNNNVDRSKINGEITVKDDFKIAEIISSVAIYGLPILFLFFIFRQMKSASGDVMSFGKSRAKLFSKESSKITFKDVAGIEDAKTEVVEIVDFLKSPKKYQAVGARVPKGILLVGPAGVGKTLLAKAIAGEANVPFFSVAGSEFMEMLVGVGSSRVRDLFATAKKTQPSLIFIDEIDAIGRQRGMGIGGGHDEREQTLNQILIEMDGFDARTQVIVLAATNRADMLDPALVRAGRFDRKIAISMPALEDRKEIIKIHMQGKPFVKDINIAHIAKKTVGFSGADIENMLNEAAIFAARNNRKEITATDVDEAALKVTLGPEKRRLQDEDDRKLSAYHEGGHALVGALIDGLDAIGRVTIVPRGGSLGHTSIAPDKDRFNESKSRLEGMLAMTMGGRAAEEVVFGDITTGAAQDIEQATSTARKMVTEYGMSSLGPISYDGNGKRFWLAKQMGDGPHYSQEMAAKIDAEVEKIISKAYKTAKDIILEKRHVLDEIAGVLLEKETLYEDEFKKLVFKE